MQDDRRSLEQREAAMAGTNEIVELANSELARASGGWGPCTGLFAGKSDKGSDVKSDVVMVAPLIG
jgi:hypothetical protein